MKMKRFAYCVCLWLAALSAVADGKSLMIWDNAGAGDRWDIAYPVGNGRLGAMPFGNFPNEKDFAKRGDHLAPRPCQGHARTQF